MHGNSSIVIGFIAAFFTTFAFAPQALKTIKTKNTNGISISMYGMFIIGVITWIIYGIKNDDVAVIFANVATLFFAVPVLIILVKNKKAE